MPDSNSYSNVSYYCFSISILMLPIEEQYNSPDQPSKYAEKNLILKLQIGLRITVFKLFIN